MIIFLSFSMLTIIISTMTVKYANDQKKNVAINTSELIYSYFSSEKFYPSVSSLVHEFTTMINILSKNAETLTIIITDQFGSIKFSTDNVFSGNITDEKVLKYGLGTDMTFIYSDISGMFDTMHGVVITPLTYSVAERAGMMLVCYDAESINDLALGTIQAVILSSLWVMIVTLIAIYFITERIIAPLRQINVATKKFASGKFDTRLPVEGNDEVTELSRSFNTMAESLANIEYTRSVFLANISHDLRTPMTTITGFIDGMLDGAIPPEKHSYYLEIIAQETRRLSRLVSQLLDISRMEAGNRKFEKSNFDICEMARIILLSFESKIDQKKLDVQFSTSKERLFVFSDKDAINQVLYNICENAVKFSREGGRYVIDIREHSDKVIVSVYNEGVGIKSEDLPHVFDRFYKSDKSRGLDKTGVGLGMYIAKTIMDNLDEKIHVSSKFGEYCCFEISLEKSKVMQGKLQALDISRNDTQ